MIEIPAPVRQAIDRELRYQEEKWGEGTRNENVLVWFAYIKDYIAEAEHVMCRFPDAESKPFALHALRKITALGVSAMKDCGVAYRADEGPRPIGYTES